MAQVTKTGEVFTDRDKKGSPAVLERVRKFAIKAGRSEARDGKVILPTPNGGRRYPKQMLTSLVRPN